MDNIQIIEKPDWVSWDEIHDLLSKAHQQNIANGMTMRTVNLSGAELKERVGGGCCYVALDDNYLIGVGSIQISYVNKWFAKGMVAKLMLGAVLPNYQGRGVYKMLLQKRIDYAQANHVGVVVMDTAEHNIKMQNILLKNGFRYVSCFVPKYSKHYSVIMAKWLEECPYSKWYCKWKFWLQMTKMKLRYKPGSVKRFGL